MLTFKLKEFNTKIDNYNDYDKLRKLLPYSKELPNM